MEGIDAHLKARAATIELLTNDPVARGGFTQVPNFILRHKELSVGAKMTYAMFLSYAWHNNYCFPGQAKMAIDMGASLRSVNSYIQELQRSGFIEIKRQGLQKPNIYKLKFVVQKNERHVDNP